MICSECGHSVDEGNHAACVRVLMAKLADKIRQNTQLVEQLYDAGILTRRRP